MEKIKEEASQHHNNVNSKLKFQHLQRLAVRGGSCGEAYAPSSLAVLFGHRF